MNFGERAAARRKSKDLKNEIRQLKKELLANGCEKTEAAAYVKDFGAALERGAALREEYETAGEHLREAIKSIGRLLDYMAESPAEEVKESLLGLAQEMDLLYHDCSIRQDDQDFKSTIQCFKQMVSSGMVQGYSADEAGMSAIMLRSELENIKAVLDEASVWEAPDFLALAYYFLHEDKDKLGEMENGQRNQYVLTYLNEHFLDRFLDVCRAAGAEQKVRDLIRDFVYCG